MISIPRVDTTHTERIRKTLSAWRVVTSPALAGEFTTRTLRRPKERDSSTTVMRRFDKFLHPRESKREQDVTG